MPVIATGSDFDPAPPILIWNQTFTGRAFYPFNPHPEMVCLLDIAHHLAMIPRFYGATRWHYSVAQHSVYVASRVPEELRPLAVLHDAAEAYLGDMTRPMKEVLHLYRGVESAVMGAICAAFNIHWPWLPTEQAIIQEADLALLAAERQQLMNESALPWKPLPDPADITIERWDPDYAKRVYLAMAEDLLL